MLRHLSRLTSPAESMRLATAAVYKYSSLLKPRTLTKFLVLSRSRTGSNMLMSFLNSHPNIRMEGETLSTLGERSHEAVLDAIYAPQPFYVQAKGFKFFYYHPTDVDPEAVWERVTSIDDLRVLHLTRANIFHTLVSRKQAGLTGKWVDMSTDTTPSNGRPLSFYFPVEEVRTGFEQTRAWERGGDETFRDHPLLSVTYEDLVYRREDEFRRITDFLDMKYLPPRTRFRKQNKKRMRDLVENYDDLKATFAGTEWGQFFDE